MEKWRRWRVRRKNDSGRPACDGEYGEAEACRTENWNSGRNGEVAGGCLTQPSGEEVVKWPPEKTLAWTHRRSFTLGVREDRYGQVWSDLRGGRVVEEQRGLWWRWRFVSVSAFSSPLLPFRFLLKNLLFNGRKISQRLSRSLRRSSSLANGRKR